jgi:RNA recognition motif-containing protein
MFHSKKSKQISCKLFVGNLATHTTSIHLQTIFHTYGEIIECVKVRERYGFVRFSTNDQAQRALNACNGLQLNGYPMIVEYAQNEILISPKSTRIYHSKKNDIPILSNLNPDASSFTCSTSDYYSQSDRPSSRSSSERSNCLSPSILSVTLPLSYSDDEDIEISQKNIYDKQQSLNIFIGDKILHLYKTNVDVNHHHQTLNSFDGNIKIISDDSKDFFL